MTNKPNKPIGKPIDKAISECTCRGLNILESLSQYYIDRFENLGEQVINKTKFYEDAKRLSNDIFNKLTDKGIKYRDDLPPIESFKKDITLKYDLDACNSGDSSSCVMALEILMGRLHQSTDAQNKLICGHSDKFLNQQHVDNFLTDIFRGEFYGGKSSNVLEMKYNPFKEHFYDKYIDMCKNYKR